MGDLRSGGVCKTTSSVLSAIAFASYAYAATFTVDRIDDDASATACTPTAAIDCSLRGAVIASNLTPGADIIEIPAGTYTLDIQGSDNNAMAGDLDLTDHVTIAGAGQDLTIIDGGGVAGLADRIFDIDPTSSGLMVELRDLTVQGGYSGAGSGFFSAAHLTVRRVTVTANTAVTTSGGGLYLAAGSVVLEDCAITNNEASSFGGGIYHVSNDDLEIIGTEIRGNTSDYDGGGLFSATLSNVTIEDCILADNVARSGGGLFHAGATGVTVSVLRTALINNTAGSGSAVKCTGGRVNLVSSTVSGNNAFLFGAAIDSESSDLPSELIATTVAENLTGGSADIEANGGSFRLTNSIISGTCGGTAFESMGGNLESPGNSCLLIHPGDRVNVSQRALRLGPLSVTGSPRPVHPIALGSFAIDLGVASGCLATDQRGETRPVDGDMDGVALCDAGAFELQLIFADGVESGDLQRWSNTGQLPPA